jgi:hypothetical protein
VFDGSKPLWTQSLMQRLAIQWGNQNSLLEKLVQRIKCFGHKWRQWFFYNFIQQILTLRKEQFNNLTKKRSCDPIIKISCKLIFGFVTKVTKKQKKSNMTGATCGAGTAYPFGAPAFNPGFWWGSCYYILSFLCNVL